MGVKDFKDRKKHPLNLGLNVCHKQCGRCLFGKDPHLPWEPHGREKVEGCLKKETHFECHEHQRVMCRGFYNKHKRDIWYIRLARQLKAINWIGGVKTSVDEDQ